MTSKQNEIKRSGGLLFWFAAVLVLAYVGFKLLVASNSAHVPAETAWKGLDKGANSDAQSSVEQAQVSLGMLMRSADDGDEQSQLILAELYLGGIGVDKDIVAARLLYENLALNGNLVAIEALKSFGVVTNEPNVQLKTTGNHAASTSPELETAKTPTSVTRTASEVSGAREEYLEALEYVSHDDSMAFGLMVGAAQKGDSGAQFALGMAYHNGIGSTVNQDHAEFWFEKAATDGGASAQLRYGLMFLNGVGVKKDKVKAKYWLSLSQSQGNTKAN